MAVKVNVKSSAGAKYALDIADLSETVGVFKTRLAAVSEIPADTQRLIFRGHVLKDAQTFQEIRDKHGLESGQTMHVVRGSSSAQRSNAATQTATAAAAAALPQPAPAAAAGAVPPPNPFGAMFGAGAGAQPGLPNVAQLMQNPEHMQALMNSPFMDSIMSNPELARTMMLANPQLRELIERNPEVGHVFNDPATFRQMMQIARNPSLMNEMMRNTDRQMANIEMMPGGFDALRRMQENIQAPLMDAVQNFGNPNAEANNNANQNNGANGDNPFASLFQNTPSNAPMPNPWAPNNGVPRAAAPTPNAPPANNTGAGAGGTATGGTAPMPGGFPNMANMANMFPGMGGIDSDQAFQMMDNPMMMGMIELLTSNPALMEAMVSSNPQLQSLATSNPQMAAMLRNPEVMRTLFNPEFMRGLLQVRSAMGGAAPGAGATPANPAGAAPTPTGTRAAPGAGMGAAPGATAGTGTGTAPAGGVPMPDMGSLMAMMNALNGLGGGAGAPPAAPQPELSTAQLEQMYSAQLQQLRDMGFLDTNMCLQALRRSNGNVNVAVENLLDQLGG